MSSQHLVAGEMAQWANCVMCKHEDLSLDPQHPHKSWAQQQPCLRDRGS